MPHPPIESTFNTYADVRVFVLEAVYSCRHVLGSEDTISRVVTRLINVIDKTYQKKVIDKDGMEKLNLLVDLCFDTPRKKDPVLSDETKEKINELLGLIRDWQDNRSHDEKAIINSLLRGKGHELNQQNLMAQDVMMMEGPFVMPPGRFMNSITKHKPPLGPKSFHLAADLLEKLLCRPLEHLLAEYKEVSRNYSMWERSARSSGDTIRGLESVIEDKNKELRKLRRKEKIFDEAATAASKKTEKVKKNKKKTPSKQPLRISGSRVRSR